MSLVYKALDLKNEIDKYRYFIGSTYNLSTVENIYLYNYSSSISKMYEDVYKIEIKLSDYITNTLIEILATHSRDFSHELVATVES